MYHKRSIYVGSGVRYSTWPALPPSRPVDQSLKKSYLHVQSHELQKCLAKFARPSREIGVRSVGQRGTAAENVRKPIGVRTSFVAASQPRSLRALSGQTTFRPQRWLHGWSTVFASVLVMCIHAEGTDVAARSRLIQHGGKPPWSFSSLRA